MAVRPAPARPPEQICSVIVSPDDDTQAKTLGSFIAEELKAGLPPRQISLLVRQRAADWERNLSPVFASHGIVLRNEDRDVGGASIQDLMTEPYTQTVIDGLDLLLRRRGGVFWIRVLETLSDMEGITDDDEPQRVQEIIRKLDAFHIGNRVIEPDAIVQPEEAAKLLDVVETFIGLGPLKAAAPQYQQGDLFENVRKATKSFLNECMSDGLTWRQGMARFRGEHQVPLMTITKSKGLEYDLVILLGLDDDQWWSFKNNPTEGHSTFFVAASRARDRLFMTICRGRQTTKISEIYGLLKQAGVRALTHENWLSKNTAA